MSDLPELEAEQRRLQLRSAALRDQMHAHVTDPAVRPVLELIASEGVPAAADRYNAGLVLALASACARLVLDEAHEAEETTT